MSDTRRRKPTLDEGGVTDIVSWSGDAVDSSADQAAPNAPGPNPTGGLHPGRMVLEAISRHRWMVLICTAIMGAIASAVIWTTVVPLYQATAQISVAPRVPRVVFQTDENGVVPLYKSYQNTQVAVILSPTVLERVLDLPDVQKTTWYKAKPAWWLGHVPPIQRLRESLSVRPINDTEIINVTMSVADAGDAQTIVDAVVDQYLAVVRESYDKTDRTRFQALSEQLREIQADIDATTATIHAASRSLGTNQPDELRTKLTTELSVLESELRSVERQRQMLEWELTQHSATESAPQDETDREANYGADPEWRRLRGIAEAARHEHTLATQRFGEAHPKMLEVRARLNYAEEALARREVELDQHAGASGEATGAAAALTGTGTLRRQIERVKRSEELLRQQVDRQRAEVTRAGDLALELSQSDEKIKRKRELYDAISARLEELDVERVAPARISIASHALKPALPASDRRILLTLGAWFGALATGVALAVLRHRLDPSVKRMDEVTSVVRIPFLGQIPKVQSTGNLLHETDESLHEHLRMIRTALLERVPKDETSVLLITSPTPATGKTTLTALLGRSLAMLGRRVLMIDADLRRPVLAARWGIPDTKGLTAVLNGMATLEQAAVQTEVRGLHLVTAGPPITPHDPELLAGQLLRTQLEKARSKYDFVLLDSPPALSVADARILAGAVDGVLLVLKASHTRRGDASEALARLTGAGCRLLGTVLVGAQPQPSYYGYGGEYGYSRHPSRQPALAAT